MRWKFSSGKLGVDRHHAGLQNHHGVDCFAALEAVLQPEMCGRQNLRQQIGQKQLAQRAAQFRGAQDLLQLGDILADVEHPLGGFLELAELLAHVADHPRGIIKPLADALVRFGEVARDLPIERLHGFGERPAQDIELLSTLLGVRR